MVGNKRPKWFKVLRKLSLFMGLDTRSPAARQITRQALFNQQKSILSHVLTRMIGEQTLNLSQGHNGHNVI